MSLYYDYVCEISSSHSGNKLIKNCRILGYREHPHHLKEIDSKWECSWILIDF